MTSPLPTSFVSIEAESADVIHARMLDQIKQYDGDTDTQEGSPVWDAERPAAEEIADLQVNIVNAVNAAIPASSWGTFLDEHAKDVGLTRKPGERAKVALILSATVDVTLPAGTVVSTDNEIRFTLDTDAVIVPPESQPDPDNPEPGTVTVQATAEDVGRTSNISAFTLTRLPREYQNLVTVRQEVAATGGLDAESDPELKARFFARQRNQSGAGNPENYRGWALEMNGVRAAKVFRADPTPGSVTIAIAAQDGVPDTALVNATQDYIDSKASVIANNIVVPAEALPIDLEATLALAPDVEISDVQDAYEASVQTYLETLYFNTANEPVRYSTLYQSLLNTDGVIDVSGFTVNGGTANILPTGRDIAVLGTVTFA